MEKVKLYAGIKSSQQWMFIVGFKVAGVKILVPWTNLQYAIKKSEDAGWEYEPSTGMDLLKEQIYSGLQKAAVTVCFMGGCYFYTRWLVKQREIEINKWLENGRKNL